MKRIVLGLSFCVLYACSAAAQTSEKLPYNDCAAIFLNSAMLVDDYSPEGKCVLDSKRKGELTLYTVSLTDHGATKVLGLPFKVAIRNKRTSTYWMYTKEYVNSILWQNILKECEKGDRLIFLTEDKQYALPHAEIAIEWE